MNLKPTFEREREFEKKNCDYEGILFSFLVIKFV